jgi:lycopene beta-cyclase
LTYLTFLLIFLLPPILILAGLAVARRRHSVPGFFRALLLVQTLALVYTTPWDNYLVYRGVWTYGSERVIGTIGYVPVEEYLFFLLQPVLTGLWYLILRTSLPPASAEGARPFRGWGPVAWGLLAAAGVLALLAPSERLLYFGLIAAWCGPVLAGMTWLGYRHLWLDRKAVALGVAVPTVYLWVADRLAIGDGIWDIAARYSTGIEPLGLPVEEALFFFFTNAMVVQGLAMFLPVREMARERVAAT